MVVALARLSWGLSMTITVASTTTTLLWQASSGSGDGGARMVANFQLVLAFVVVAR